MKKNLSIIIVNYNAGGILEKCVRSTLSEKFNSEVIVVDNASTDGSLAQIIKISALDKRLQIHRNSINAGFSVACNIGINIAQGHFLLFLNPDCILDIGTTYKLVNTLENNRGAGMAGGLLINPDGTEQAGGRRAVPTPWRTFVRVLGLTRLNKRYPKLFSDFNLFEQPLPKTSIEVEAISGACMLVRREALINVGNLDENYFLHCEDLDWCMRFRLKGWKILFVPDAIVTHYSGSCSQTRPIFVEWNKHKGMLRFYRKFFSPQYPGILMWIVAFGVWLRFCFLVTLISVKRLFR